ncbi:unnamed protein product [Lactuca saligna]|uniref:Riboflavin synthase n=1 Tax=Lactuca saligna TaxID=75948 RepID=A0AA35Z2F1_LACSI|nr:unnamed protein product [Lactuca saligna]
MGKVRELGFDESNESFDMEIHSLIVHEDVNLGGNIMVAVVNLERAVKPSTRIGGCFLQGHVDGTGEIVSMEVEGDSLWIKAKMSPEILNFIMAKGFIAGDGTSLTVVDMLDEKEYFKFLLVEYTQQKVVIPLKKIGLKVNLEMDILGKYVERLLGNGFVECIESP